ncbi:MAG TPA: type II toxin-antitoxin system HicA family toxin [Bacteroidia bacterium]|nr:type II toxin-antitoxin system HicA family toxin [Bacteroidia bacterium]
MDLTSKRLIRLLEANGFVLSRSKGSHHIFRNESSNKTVVVPVHSKDLKKGTFLAILKQAGIEI